MLNEEKIILMTKLAVYEEKEKKKSLSVVNYYRKDYLALHMLKMIVYGTVAFAMGFGLWALNNLEDLFVKLYDENLASTITYTGIYYGIFMVILLLITYIVYSRRYAGYKKKLKEYHHNLKDLGEIYNEKESDVFYGKMNVGGDGFDQTFRD